MKLLIRTTALLILVFCSQSLSSLAAEPAVFSVIPRDTLVVVTLRDLSTLDGKVGKLATELGFGPISSLWLAKGQLQIVEGIDERGTAAVLLVPAKDSPDTRREIVLLVPTLDREKMLAFLQPEPIGEGYSKVKLKGRDAYVGTKESFSVFGPSLETVKGVVEADNNIAAELSAHQKQRFGINDLSLIVNVKSLSSHSGFDDFRRIMAVFGLDERELQTCKTWQFSARLDDAGVAVEIYTEKKQAEEVAAPAGAAGSLLAGLPAEGFVWAMGMTGIEARSRALSISGAVLDYLDKEGHVNASRRGDLEEAIREMASHTARVSTVVSALPEGPDGLVTMTKIVETNDDPRRLLTAVENFVATLGTGVFTDADVIAAIGRITVRKDAERSGSIVVDHLVMDLSNLEKFDETGIKRVFGRDGLLVRLGVVDDKHLVHSLGGGLRRFEEVATLVRAGAAPLASDELIKRGATALPAARVLEAHVAPDRLADLAKRLARAMDVSIPPVTVAKVDAPLSIAVHPVGPAARQLDLRVPRSVVVALAKAVVDLAASQIGAGGAQTP